MGMLHTGLTTMVSFRNRRRETERKVEKMMLVVYTGPQWYLRV